MPPSQDREVLSMIQSYNTIILTMLTMYNNRQAQASAPASAPLRSNRQLNSLLQTLLQSAESSTDRRPHRPRGVEAQEEGEEEFVMSFLFDLSGAAAGTEATIPAVPRLTQRQILENTRLFVYTENETLDNITCPISHVDFEYGDILCEINRCLHTFKHAEIMQWLDINTTCPVCRAPVQSSIGSALRNI